MKTPAAALAALILGGCAPRSGAAFDVAHRAAIVDSVRTLLAGWTGAMNRRQSDSAAAWYSGDRDFRWIENGEIRYTSPAEVREAMAEVFPSLRGFALTLVDPTITPLAPGVAAVTASFTQTMTDTTGHVTGVAGAMSMTVVHGDSGWRILVGQAATLSVPPAAAPAPSRHP